MPHVTPLLAESIKRESSWRACLNSIPRCGFPISRGCLRYAEQRISRDGQRHCEKRGSRNDYGSAAGTKLTPWVRRRKGCFRTLSRLQCGHFGVRAHAREGDNRRASGLLGKPDCTAYAGMVAQAVARCLASIRRSKLPYRGPAMRGKPVCRLHGGKGGGPTGERNVLIARDATRRRPRQSVGRHGRLSGSCGA